MKARSAYSRNILGHGGKVLDPASCSPGSPALQILIPPYFGRAQDLTLDLVTTPHVPDHWFHGCQGSQFPFSLKTSNHPPALKTLQSTLQMSKYVMQKNETGNTEFRCSDRDTLMFRTDGWEISQWLCNSVFVYVSHCMCSIPIEIGPFQLNQ